MCERARELPVITSDAATSRAAPIGADKPAMIDK